MWAPAAGVADTVRLTEKYPFVYGAVGVHPDEIGTLDEEKMKWLKSLCDLPKVVAVGRSDLIIIGTRNTMIFRKSGSSARWIWQKRQNFPL